MATGDRSCLNKKPNDREKLPPGCGGKTLFLSRIRDIFQGVG